MELREILLVDEKSPIVGNISCILQDRGYLVMLAPDAMTAFEDVENYHFDLILVSLGGNEIEKLNLMRRAKRSSPQAKLIVVGNPNMTIPVEGFKFEVDDYLLAPFTAMELSMRVERCLRGDNDNVVQGIPEEKADVINGLMLNSLRFKFRFIHNGLLSLKAHINTLIYPENNLLDDVNVSIVHEISHDLLMLTSPTENVLYNMLICCKENQSYPREIDHAADYFEGD